jgi:hypothetical protein
MTYLIFAYTEKTVSDFSVPSRDVINQTLPGREAFVAVIYLYALRKLNKVDPDPDSDFIHLLTAA